MADNALSKIVAGLRRAALLHGGTAQTDAKLLTCYVESRDETAFEALLLRHGPMVLGVCRRILRHAEDIEDAFQATFLVLVRKAGSVRPREQFGNWLYGVAHQTAVRTRALSARRGTRERQVAVIPDMASREPFVTTQEKESWQVALDQELSYLPIKYRSAIILCDLQGRTQKEAARQLGWPEGSVASRLARGRALLAKRLAKHGAVFSVEALAAALSANAASAHVPAALASATLKAAASVAAGQMAVGAVVSMQVVAITKGVLASMFLSKIKTVAVVGVMVFIVSAGIGASFLAAQTQRAAAQAEVQRSPSERTGSARGQEQGAAGEPTAPQVEKKAEIQRETKVQTELERLRLDLIEKDQQIRDLRAKLQILADRMEVIQSQHELQLKAAAKAAEPKKEIMMLTPRHLDVMELGQTLTDLFNRGDGAGAGPGGFGGGKGGVRMNRMRIALSPSTNTLILEGTEQDMKTAESIAAKLDVLAQEKKATATKTESKRESLGK